MTVLDTPCCLPRALPPRVSDTLRLFPVCPAPRRIKAFRAPAPGSDEDDDMSLRHTLSTVVKGLEGSHAGLHVLGDSLLAVNGEGARACGRACTLYGWKMNDSQRAGGAVGALALSRRKGLVRGAAACGRECRVL